MPQRLTEKIIPPWEAVGDRFGGLYGSNNGL